MRGGFVEHASGRVGDAAPRPTSRRRPAATSGRCRPRAAGIAILKWVTSFPGNPAAGLPVVMGAICVSSAADGELLALVDVRAVTALRTGAVAAVAAQELARPDAATVGIVGCGLHGAWAARCLADAEYGPGVCFDPDPDAAGRLAGELGWEVGGLDDALACDVVTCVTPGSEPVIARERRAPRACTSTCSAPTGPARPRPSRPRWRACELFCDEWEQASHGGELTGRGRRPGSWSAGGSPQLGDVLTGAAPAALEPRGGHALRQHRASRSRTSRSAWRCSRRSATGASAAQTVNL